MKSLVCLSDMTEYNWLRAEKACCQLSRDEWAVVSCHGPRTVGEDNFAHLSLLDERNMVIPLCSHNHNTKPRPPTWYLTLLSFRRERKDVFESELNLDRLFRKEEDDSKVEIATPLVTIAEPPSGD